MLEPALIEDIAAQLLQAEQSRTPMDLLSLKHPGMTVEDAYAVQRVLLARKLAGGRRLKGHKIGLTSRAMQQAVGIDEPDYGFLLDDMFYGDGAKVPTDRYIGLRIEAELAFVLKSALRGPDCTLFDVLNATDYVLPALEIIDTRLHRVDPATRRPRTVVDTISDNASNAAVVLGGRPFKPLESDLRWVGAIVFRNGQVEETGLAAAVLNHPATGIAWLANRLAGHGEALEAGEVVLAGSFIRPIEAAKGDVFHADYGRYGSVSCQFV